VLYIRWNYQRLSGMDGYDFIAIQGKAQSAFEDVGDLLVVVAVFGNDTALAQKQPR